MKTFNPIFLPHTPKNEFNYIGAAERYFEKINGGFAPETKDAYIDYYNNNIFPCISYGKRIDDYTVEYVEDLILKIKEENNYQDSTIRSTIRHLVYDPCKCFFHEFHSDNHEFDLTPNDWHLEENETANESIQLRIKKSLSVKEEKKAFKELFKDPRTEQGEYIALATQLLIALRLNEVCGANYSDIIEMFDYPDCYYIQITKSTEVGKNTLKAGGKTYNAFRRIPLVNVLKDFLLARIEFLESSLSFPYIYGDITYNSAYDLPITCKGKEYGRRCSSQELGEIGRDFLRYKVGMSKEEVAGVEFAYYQDKGSEYDLGEKSPTTYLLRRNLATHLYSLGFTITESQYIMGHKMENTDLRRSDFGDEQFLYELLKKFQYHPLNQIRLDDIEVKGHLELDNTYRSDLILNPGDYTINVKNKELDDTLQIETGKSVKNFEVEEKNRNSVGSKEINIVKEIRKAYKNSLE